MPKMITMRDLLQAGILEPNEQLSCERDGESHIGYLNADGTIQYEHSVFATSSAWSGYIKGRNSNGWREVFTRGKNLAFFREEFRQRQRDTMATNSGKILLPSSTQERGYSVAETNDRYKPKPPPNLTPSNSNTDTGPNQRIAELSDYIQNLNQKIASIEQRITTSGGESKTSIIDDLRSRVLNLTPTDFERLVGEFMKAKGFSNVRVTQQSNDGGIDGECEMPFIKVKVAFQAKRYAQNNNVGIEPVQRLNGTLGSSFDRGVLITTSSFTPGAKSWIDEEDPPITLIDGDELMTEMIDLGLGIKSVTVVMHELDEEFFTNLE